MPTPKRCVLIAFVAAAGSLFLLLLRQLGDSPARRLDRLQRQEAPAGGQVYVAILDGEKQAFLLQDCKLDLLDLSQRRVRRQRVLQPEFYPFAVCMEQSITQQDGTLEVHLLMRALGSGGGNQGGGTYRSLNGRQWKRI